MIWGSQLRILFIKTVAISLRHGIYTSSILFARRTPRAIRYEPGMRHQEKILAKLNAEFPQELKNDNDLDDDFDLTNVEEAYDVLVQDQKKHRKRVQQKIIAKKFFAPRPQPLMLTWNERQCIKYLHNKDPVQWNIKSLSESFPATPDTVKKIIKSRNKISPEKAKLLDLKAQKNWELLAEGKLDADLHVLNHLKKFINRKEILLEQINKTDFYLPEVKKEPVWNQGEMNKILEEYEKALNKLGTETQQSETHKVLNDGVSEEKNIKKEEKSSLDLIHETIKMEFRKEPELKESFIFGGMIDAFRKNITLEELESKIIEKADKNKKLDLTEKAVLESKLGVNSSEKIRNINKNSNHTEYISSIPVSENEKSLVFTPSLKKSLKLESRNYMETDKKSMGDKVKTEKSKPDKLVSVNNKLQFFNETEISKVLSADLSLEKTKVTEEKSEIDFSDPVRLQNEKVYYDQQVSDIKNTAFWNNGRKSQEKAMAEFNKQPIPAFSNEAYIYKTVVLSTDVYPERIKIPKNKQGSGLTFRVKDCYYDDDGEFLYRVPGMTK